jgi:hypothetical protein
MIDSSIKAWVEPVVVRIARFGIPSIYMLEFALWLALMGAFFGTISFLDAVPAHSLGNSVPASWEAAVHNHGELIRWYLKDNHPVAFGFTVLVLMASIVGMVLVHTAEAQIRRTKGEGKSEKIAVIALMATVLLMSYLVMTHLGRMYVVPAV